MQQILNIQPTLPQTQQSAAGGSDAQNSFSPHLDTAIHNQKNQATQQKAIQNKNTAAPSVNTGEVSSPQQNPAGKVPYSSSGEDPDALDNSKQNDLVAQSVEAAALLATQDAVSKLSANRRQLSDIFFKIIASENTNHINKISLPTPDSESTQDTSGDTKNAYANYGNIETMISVALNRLHYPIDYQSIQISENQLANDPATAGDLNSANYQLGKITEILINQYSLQNLESSGSAYTNYTDGAPLNSNQQKNLIQLPQTQSDSSSSPNSINFNEKMLAQLQQIITSSSETGEVTISHTPGSATSSVSQNSQLWSTSPVQQSVQLVTAHEMSTASITVSSYMPQDESVITSTDHKQTQELTGVRIDTKQQFYDAKISGENSSAQYESREESQENTEASNQFDQQSKSSNKLQGPAANSEQTNTFAQFAKGIQNTDTTITETSKPVIPLTTHLAHEQEVLQQLVDKFQINIRKPDTSLNIKLHPAELGELRIDLTVKEGSIRANVVAQSQHVQEILQKNLPRLKTVLEDQGFTVDHILITSESDSVGEFDLFENQLLHKENYIFSAQKQTQNAEASFLTDGNQTIDSVVTSGVNVTI